MTEAAAPLSDPAPDADGADLLRRLADILAGRREGGRLSLDEAEALVPAAYGIDDLAQWGLPLALRKW